MGAAALTTVGASVCMTTTIGVASGTGMAGADDTGMGSHVQALFAFSMWRYDK